MDMPHNLLLGDLAVVMIVAGSLADGRLIGELELRTRTGASAVGSERNGAPIVNPGPDEELRAGDKVLLLGTREQLAATRDLLNERAETGTGTG
jgi:K+/H+ antiporter YhaU regulatory subunit KhtT